MLYRSCQWEKIFQEFLGSHKEVWLQQAKHFGMQHKGMTENERDEQVHIVYGHKMKMVQAEQCYGMQQNGSIDLFEVWTFVFLGCGWRLGTFLSI